MIYIVIVLVLICAFSALLLRNLPVPASGKRKNSLRYFVGYFVLSGFSYVAVFLMNLLPYTLYSIFSVSLFLSAVYCFRHGFVLRKNPLAKPLYQNPVFWINIITVIIINNVFFHLLIDNPIARVLVLITNIVIVALSTLPHVSLTASNKKNKKVMFSLLRGFQDKEPLQMIRRNQGENIVKFVIIFSSATLLGFSVSLLFGLSVITYLAIIMPLQMLYISLYLGAFFALYFSDITVKLEKAAIRLNKKTKEAEEANKAKTHFLAAASHDLRQPIHALNLFLAALENSPLNEEQAKIIRYAKTSGYASQEMLSSILDYSNLQAAGVSNNPQNVEISTIFRQLEEEFGTQADIKQLIYRTRDTQLCVHVDPKLLVLVLRNLISNAIRYTEYGGILVAAHRRHQSVFIGVWDTGIGLDSKDLSVIFKEFHQLNKNSQGLGLGLSTVKQLCHLMNINIILRSTINRGSAFCIEVPLAKTSTRLSAVSDTVLPATYAVPIKHLLDKCILVIDDNCQVLQAFDTLLTTWGCRVHTCEHAELAAILAKTYRPQLIISDHSLKNNITSDSFIPHICRSLEPDAPKVIIVTGDNSPEILIKHEDIALAVLHKPVDPQLLLKYLLKIFPEEE